LEAEFSPAGLINAKTGERRLREESEITVRAGDGERREGNPDRGRGGLRLGCFVAALPRNDGG
jgi:hypothetical protein